jgi:hypothetical protein
MPLVSPAIALSVAANATSANVMAGNLYEYLKRPSIIEFGLVSSAAGILATVLVGGEVLMQDQEISGANRFPILPDDFLLKHAGRAGAQIYITLRNRTGGALTNWVILNITPVG